MAKAIFYNKTIKNLIVSFGTVFNNIRIVNDYGVEVKVPLHYSNKEKFIVVQPERGDFTTGTNYETTVPRLGFELMSMEYDTARMVSPLNRISRTDGTSYVYSRIPYNFNFNLYVLTKKYEESLQIVEQVFPFFIPELNITVDDFPGYDFKTDIPIVLTSSETEIDYEGDFSHRRSNIVWTLGFTMKAWLYGDEKKRNVIKKTIVDLKQMDFDKIFETLMSEVVPFEAGINDDHTILDTIINPDE